MRLQQAGSCLLAILLAVPPVVGAVGAGVGADAPAYASMTMQPRGSILIDQEVGPTGFILGTNPMTGEPIHNTAMGVRGGNGTAEDPYMIHNWTITHTTPWGILINGTSSHVLIENVTIPGNVHPAELAGVRLVDAENVTIDNVWIRKTNVDNGLVPVGHAVDINGGGNLTLKRSRLGPFNTDVEIPFADVINVEGSDGVTVRNVTTVRGFEMARLLDASNVTFEHVTANPGPMTSLIRVERSHNVSLHGNHLEATRVNLFDGTTFTGSGNVFNATAPSTDPVDPLSDVTRVAIGVDVFQRAKAVELCGNAFEGFEFDQVGSAQAGNLTLRGNDFRAEGDVDVSADNATVTRNAFEAEGPLEIGVTGAEVHLNSFANTTLDDMNEFFNPLNASSNWWDDPEGPDLFDQEGFSEDGDPLALEFANRENVTFRPFLDQRPDVGPSAVDCGDPSIAGVQERPPERVFGPVHASAAVSVGGKSITLGRPG